MYLLLRDFLQFSDMRMGLVFCLSFNIILFPYWNSWKLPLVNSKLFPVAQQKTWLMSDNRVSVHFIDENLIFALVSSAYYDMWIWFSLSVLTSFVSFSRGVSFSHMSRFSPYLSTGTGLLAILFLMKLNWL